MNIDKYKLADGGYQFTDGCYYEDGEQLIQVGILGFCDCGAPEESLSFVMDGLAYIDRLRGEAPPYKDRETIAEWCKKWTADGLELFGSERARWFFYYWAAAKDLTEHGGSVPGWLTEAGRSLLADLRQLFEESEDA